MFWLYWGVNLYGVRSVLGLSENIGFRGLVQLRESVRCNAGVGKPPADTSPVSGRTLDKVHPRCATVL